MKSKPIVASSVLSSLPECRISSACGHKAQSSAPTSAHSASESNTNNANHREPSMNGATPLSPTQLHQLGSAFAVLHPSKYDELLAECPSLPPVESLHPVAQQAIQYSQSRQKPTSSPIATLRRIAASRVWDWVGSRAQDAWFRVMVWQPNDELKNAASKALDCKEDAH